IISGIFSLLDLDDSILIKSQGIILGIITILCGGFITALELNKLPLKYSVLFKIDLNRGILYFVISVVLLGSGLASFLVLIAGILFIVKNYI
ncbi:MAG: hypothetical protein OEY49_13255, partial [Candidatus Heimdallarchaeota archaeon]|nr:hypothetical protein [Candidatus Heimdallarchaeota archaeon]